MKSLALSGPILVLFVAASGCSGSEDSDDSTTTGAPPAFAGQLGAEPGSNQDQQNGVATGNTATNGATSGGGTSITEGQGQGSTDLVGTTNVADTSSSAGETAVPDQTATGAGGASMGAMGVAGGGMGGSTMTPIDTSNANPSSGCGQASATATPDVPNNLIELPDGYDGTTPMPLVFGFHGAGRTNEDQRLVDSRTDGGILEQNYIVAYMKSAGNGWDLNTDRPRFETARQEILSELCVDTNSVFAFGHSSGAQFITQMLGTGDPEFTGVSVVASSRYGNPAWEPVPTLVIHGLNDNQRGGDNDGAQDLGQYTESNGCSNQTQPVNVTACNSIDTGNPAVDSGCVEFVGCGATTIFCNHDDPNYSGTNHGWPCFANDEIFKFFQALR